MQRGKLRHHPRLGGSGAIVTHRRRVPRTAGDVLAHWPRLRALSEASPIRRAEYQQGKGEDNMTKITLEYYGMPGEGRTVKEAKQDAGARIEKALDGDYSPILVQWNGLVCVAYRHPMHGWGYRFIHEETPVQYVSHCSSGFDGREECTHRMLVHIADVTHRRGDVEADALIDCSALPTRRREEAKSEIRKRFAESNAYWQRYDAAIAAGHSEEAARQYAHGNPFFRNLVAA